MPADLSIVRLVLEASIPVQLVLALLAACGAAGVRVRGEPDLGRELRAALTRSGPTLIEVVAADFRPPP